MKRTLLILSLLIGAFSLQALASEDPELKNFRFDFYGVSIDFQIEQSSIIDFEGPLSQENVSAFYEKLNNAKLSPVISMLQSYRDNQKPDDWLFYQLIRKTAQQLSPKQANYDGYTLYKWFFLTRSGYDAILSYADNKILFYVQCSENIYNIPARVKNGRQYVCLNYHDYGNIDFTRHRFTEISLPVDNEVKGFSYKVTQLPVFNPGDYEEKDIRFTYYANEYNFKVKLNTQVKSIFANYPVVDYGYYFNIPLSQETYSSLIPTLKKNIGGMSRKNGVDYLMRFTRSAFMYKKDSDQFGKEKRLTPEETLLYNQSDCEDRAALFFYLVKEIYDLPMLVLSYPGHVTVAVQFEKANGNAIIFNGKKFYICEPTPQKEDLKIGETLPSLSKEAYEVVYAYTPVNK